ncbi:MAG: glycosyltransferase family 4 protein [Firmicutes bacterium]|nr:glycosyltransferase family 4 protein [Bacillota bacterium]
MENMKVAVDARGAFWFRGTGIGTYTYQLVKGLAESEDFEYLFFDPVSSPLSKQIKAANVQWKSVIEHPSWQVEQVQMMHSMAAEGVDLYHMPQNGLNMPTELSSCLPIVVTLHDVIPFILPQTCNLAFRRRFLTQMSRIADKSSGIITVSHHSKADIIRHLSVSPEKITVVYPAPEPIYVPLPKDACREFLREHYGLSGAPLVFYVGGFSMRKNVHLLLRAFAQGLRKLGPEARLVLVGRTTPEVAELKQWAAWLGITQHVVYPGHIQVRHLPEFYGAADVFVYPSLYEGFGLPPLEAMACGIPTIVSCEAALPEVVGEGAWQIDPYNSAELCAAILEVVLNDKTASKLSRQGQAWVRRYSWKKAVHETLMVYKRILSDGKRLCL